MELIGKKIKLRDWKLADVDEYEKWQRNDLEWKQFDGPYFPLDEAKMPAWMDKMRDLVSRANWPTPRQRMVIADEATDAFVGVVSWYWESEATDWLSMGIVIYDPVHWGCGIGFEAMGLWGDYLLREMPQLVRLGLVTWSGNGGMMRLAEKLGFQQESCFRMARIVRGEYFDSIGYGVLRTEWEALYPTGFGEFLNG